MSSVDKRVVQLSINNKQFISGIKESLTSLTELKQAMQMEKATQSLSSIDKAVNGMDFSGIQNGIQSIQDRFSTWGIVSMRIISEITNSVINLGKRLSNITIGQIMTGGQSRATNIQKANLMLEGLLDTQDEIDLAMEDANAAVADTAYGLDEAAVVAAQLTASGVKIGKWGDDTGKTFDTTAQKALALGDDMSKALIAVSGLAGMTGSSYSEIGQIFTTVASNGRLMTEQVRQFSSRGLNVAAALGEQLGKSESEINTMVTKGKIDFQTFADAMLAAFGDQAYQANRTFTGVMSNTKAALSKIGANIWTPLIQNTNKAGTGLTNLVQIFGTVKDKLNDFNKAFANPLGNIDSEDKTDESKWGEWVKFVDTVSTRVNESLKKIDATGAGESLLEVFNDILPKAADKIVGFIDVLEKFNDYIGTNVSSTLFNMKATVSTAFEEAFGDHTVTKLNKTIEAIDKALGNNKSSATDVVNDKFIKLDKNLETIRTTLSKLVNPFSLVKRAFSSFIETLITTENLDKIADILLNITNAISNFFNEITGNNDGIKDASNSIGSGLGGALTVILNVIHKITPLLEPIGTILGKLVVLAFDIAKGFGNVASAFGDLANGTKSNLGIFDALQSVLEKIASLDIHVDVFELIVSTLEKIKSIGGSVINFLVEFKDSFLEFIKTGNENGSIANLFNSLRELSNFGLLSGLVVGFVNLTDAIAKFSSGAGIINIINAIKSIPNTIPTTINKIVTSISTLTGLSTSIAGEFKKLATSLLILAAALFILSKINPDALTQSIIAITVLLGVILKFTKKLSQIDSSKSIKGVSKGKGVLGLFSNKFNLNKIATSLVGIAASLLIIAAAVKILSSIDGKSLINGLLAIGFIMLEIVAFAKLTQDAGLEKSGPSFLAIAASLIVVALALKILATIDEEGLTRGLAAMFVVLAVMTAVILALSKLSGSAGNAIGAAGSLLILSLALIPITVSLMALSLLDEESLVNGLEALCGALVVMGIIIEFMAVTLAPNIGAAIGVAGSLLILSLALLPVTASIFTLALIPDESLGLGLQALFGSLVIMALIIEILGLSFAPNIGAAIGAAASLLIVSISLMAVTGCLVTLSMLDTGNLITSMVALNVTLIIMTGVITVLADMAGTAPMAIAGAAAILIVSLALIPIATAIVMVGSIGFAGMMTGVIALAVSLGIIALEMANIGLVAGAIAIGAAALGAIGLALLLLAPAIQTMGEVDGIAAGAALLVIIPGLLALSAVSPLLALLGVALIPLGLGFMMFAPALKTLSEVDSDAIGNVLISISTPLLGLSLIAGNLAVLGLALIPLGIGLMILAPALLILQNIDVKKVADFFESLAPALQSISENAYDISTVADNMGTIATAVLTISVSGGTAASALTDVSSSLTSLSSTISTVLETGVIESITTTLETATTTITSFSTSFTAAAILLMTALVTGITSGMTLVTTALTSLESSVTTTLGNLKRSGYSIGYNFISGFITGMNANAYSASTVAYSIGVRLLSSIKKALDINSPSKEAAKVGKFFDQGLVNGLRRNASDIYEEAHNTGDAALEGLSDSTKNLDSIVGELSDPTIKPLMDISDIQNSMATIDGLFGQRSMELAAQAAYGADIYKQSKFSNEDLNNLSTMLSDYISNQAASGNSTYEFSIPLNINGKQFAKATGKYTQDQLNVLSTQADRRKGLK